MDDILIKFDNDIKMYDYLENMLNEGYEIIETIGLSLKIKKDNDIKLLSFTDKLELNSFDVVKPDFDDSLLGIASSIKKLDGKSYTYKPHDDVVDRKYKHIVTLILDGLGTHILEKLPEDSFLRRNYFKSIHAIYPSTTAAATTSIKCGVSPLESGWTGWENYLREINRDVVLFTGINYFTDEPTGVLPFKYIPYKQFYEGLDIKGAVIEPDFVNRKLELDYVLKNSFEGLKNNDEYQYVYHPEPDTSLHELGLCDTVINKLIEIDKKVEAYANKLPSDTLLIISADHGHINVKPLDLYNYNLFTKMYSRNPANDARCIVFNIKAEFMDEFPKLFNQCFKNIYKLYKTEDAIALGFFGRGKEHERIHDFLGDYVAMAINEYYFNYKCIGDIVFKSHHAGITNKEMIIPICRYVK